MSEYITLLGAEDVQRAASRIQSAADDMNRAASSMEGTLDNFLRRFESLVERLEALDNDDG